MQWLGFLKTTKLWVRVMVPVSAMVMVVMGILTAMLVRHQHKIVNEQIQRQNIMLADTIEGAIFEALATGDNTSVRSQFRQLGSKLSKIKVFIYDFNGNIAFSTDPDAISHHLESQLGQGPVIDALKNMLQNGQQDNHNWQVSISGQPFSVVSLPITNQQRCFHCHGATRKVLGGITVATSTAAARDAIAKGRNRSIMLSFGGLLVLVGTIYLLFLFLVNRPVKIILDAAQRLGQGDFTVKLEQQSQDEIGHIAHRINQVTATLRQTFRQVLENGNRLATSAKDLASISEQLTSSAAATSETTNTVAAAMEQTSTNISAVAGSAGQLSATVDEIAQNSGNSRKIIDKAVSQAKQISSIIEELGQAAHDIDEVTDAIRDISEQVNLLALNATIEAARAGEAGKGFAVVAQEIKDLAKQTAEATNKADEKLHWMQVKATETYEEIRGITQVIEEADQAMNTIAAAVQQQSAATAEISSNVTQASEGLEEVNQNVSQSATASAQVAREITRASEETNHIAGNSRQVAAKADDLSHLADELKAAMTVFKV